MAPPQPPRAASITVSPSEVTLVSLGETASFTALIMDQNGRAYAGTPSWSSSDATVFTVDGSGLVTAVANGSGTVTASFERLSATASVEVAQAVASLAVVSGEGQRAGPGMALPEPVVVLAVDAGGSPVAGARVVFTPGDGHGTVDPGEAVTDTSGLAQAVWTLGVAEEQTLTAAVADGPSVEVRATLLTPDERVSALEVVSGDGQRGEVGMALPEPVVVLAVDAGGSPVAGARVVFTPGDGHGTVDPGEAVTDTSGLAEAVWTLGAAEEQTLTAAVRDVSVQVAATASNPDRAALEAYYHATGGPNWEDNTNWLTDAPLGEWHGLTVDDDGRVTRLSSWFNKLIGQIPPEIGDLSHLEDLNIGGNPGLTGPIPPETGNLSLIRWMTLIGNGLMGRIPPEIGDLSSLMRLGLSYNRLTGEIPVEIGNLSRLAEIWLANNRLTGPIPPVLGTLPLRQLHLGRNQLTGTIPPELGRLAGLLALDLSENSLTGNLPAELSGLRRLLTLNVAGNPNMSGVVPSELTALGRLRTLLTGGTGLCVARGNESRAWLASIPNVYASLCAPGSAVAYLTQAVQSIDYPVSLVAGEDALLRVFVTADDAGGAHIPPMRATFFANGQEVHVAEIAGQESSIPAAIEEGSLEASANVAIPGSVLVPGLEMVVEVDPGGTLDPELEIQKRIPETGRLVAGVQAVPTFDLVIVPFIRQVNPDTSIIRIVNELSPDDDLFGMTRTLLPIEEMEITAHDPVWTSSKNTADLLREIGLLKVAEGGTAYYLGTTRPRQGGGGATAAAGVAIADLEDWVVAHELGHTLSLLHAPCGDALGVDPLYPYDDGSIGAWGYDLRSDSLVPPNTPELMGYCGSEWISDYSFRKALGHRLTSETRPSAAETVLLLWGGANADGEPFLEPSFVVDAPPVLRAHGGLHRISGLDGRGNEIFSLSFDMEKTADGDGSSSFTFALPVRPEWAGELARIALSGPGGSAELGREGPAVALLRDPATGRVRGILRDWAEQDLAAAGAPPLAPEPGLEVQVSRGIPGAGSWRR